MFGREPCREPTDGCVGPGVRVPTHPALRPRDGVLYAGRRCASCCAGGARGARGAGAADCVHLRRPAGPGASRRADGRAEHPPRRLHRDGHWVAQGHARSARDGGRRHPPPHKLHCLGGAPHRRARQAPGPRGVPGAQRGQERLLELRVHRCSPPLLRRHWPLPPSPILGCCRRHAHPCRHPLCPRPPRLRLRNPPQLPPPQRTHAPRPGLPPIVNTTTATTTTNNRWQKQREWKRTPSAHTKCGAGCAAGVCDNCADVCDGAGGRVVLRACDAARGAAVRAGAAGGPRVTVPGGCCRHQPRAAADAGGGRVDQRGAERAECVHRGDGGARAVPHPQRAAGGAVHPQRPLRSALNSGVHRHLRVA